MNRTRQIYKKIKSGTFPKFILAAAVCISLAGFAAPVYAAYTPNQVLATGAKNEQCGVDSAGQGAITGSGADSFVNAGLDLVTNAIYDATGALNPNDVPTGFYVNPTYFCWDESEQWINGGTGTSNTFGWSQYAHPYTHAGDTYTPTGNAQSGLPYSYANAVAFSIYSPPASASASTLSATLSVAPASITIGASAALSWGCTNAVSASIDNGIGSVSPSGGTMSVSPSQTVTYTLTCSGSGGSTSSYTIIPHDKSMCTGTLINFGSDKEPTANFGAPDQAGTTQAHDLTADEMAGAISDSQSSLVSPSVSPPADLATNPQNYCFEVATKNTLNSGTYNYSWFSGNGYAAKADNNTQYGIQAHDIATFGPGSAGNATASATLTVTGAPATPALSCPATLATGQAGSFTVQGTDSATTQVRYGIDWTSAGTVGEWTPSSGYVAGGTLETVTHTFASPGTYTINALTQDSNGSVSGNASCTVPVTGGNICGLSASATTVPAGQTVTLTWSSTPGSTVTIDNGVGTVSPASGGSVTVTPSKTTTYTATCVSGGSGSGGSGSGGTSGTTQTSSTPVTIVVNNSTGVSALLNATPSAIIRGLSSLLTWSSQNAATCSGTNFATGGKTSGTLSVSPLDSTLYTLTCDDGKGNKAYDSQTVTVSAPALSISASPTIVRKGDTSIISWSVIGKVSSCTVSGPGLSSALLSGSQSEVISEQSTYTLSCAAGNFTPTASVTVSVAPSFKEF